MVRARVFRASLLGAILLAFAAGTAATGQVTAPDAAPDAAGSRAVIRSGNHADFGRIVIDLAGDAGLQFNQDGDHVVVRFSDDVVLSDPPALPRNVTAMTTRGSIFELTVKHGAKFHPMQLDGRAVLEILDPADHGTVPAKASPSEARPVSPRPAAASPAPGGRTAADGPAAASAISTISVSAGGAGGVASSTRPGSARPADRGNATEPARA